MFFGLCLRFYPGGSFDTFFTRLRAKATAFYAFFSSFCTAKFSQTLALKFCLWYAFLRGSLPLKEKVQGNRLYKK